MTILYRNCLILYRNFSLSISQTSWAEKPHRTRVDIENLVDSIRLLVSIPRSWNVRPGQYVYIIMAKTGLLSIFQRHPFLVAESKEDGKDLELRIHPQEGFTRRLLAVPVGERLNQTAFIEGPYGFGYDLREFGTVVMLASGTGLLAHIAYINHLLHEHKHFNIKTRDILLIWHTENDDHYDLIESYISALLDEDKARKKEKGNERSHRVNRPGIRPKPSGENARALNACIKSGC